MMGSYVESLIAHYANIDSYSIQGLRDRLYEAISNHPEAAAMLLQERNKPKYRPQLQHTDSTWSNRHQSRLGACTCRHKIGAD